MKMIFLIFIKFYMCFYLVNAIDCENDKYSPIKLRVPPVFDINLDDSPEIRWKSVIEHFHKPLSILFDYFNTDLYGYKKVFNFNDTDNLGNLIYTFPSEYQSELIGIAKISNFNNSDISFLNIFYYITLRCTSIIARNPRNRQIYHARNLDLGNLLGWNTKNETWFIAQYLRNLVLNVNFYRGGSVLYKATTFAGYLGIFTGVKPNGFSISINQSFRLGGGLPGLFQWIFDNFRSQSWVTLLARQAFESQSNYYATLLLLSSVPLLAPTYYIISGPYYFQGAVITRDRFNTVDYWQMQDNDWFLVQTNYNHWEEQPFYNDKVTPAKHCLNKIGSENISFNGLFNVLSTQPILNKLTIYSTLIQVKTGQYETYIQDCRTPCSLF